MLWAGMQRSWTWSERRILIGVPMMFLTACVAPMATPPPASAASTATEVALCSAWQRSLPGLPPLPSRGDTAATAAAVWAVRAAIAAGAEVQAAVCAKGGEDE